MKIGIDCRTILHPGVGEHAGVGYYTDYLVKELLRQDKENDYVLFFDSRFKQFSRFRKPNVKIVPFPFYQYKKYLPVTYSQMLISAILNRENLDVFHSPANILPLPYNRPAVVTVHDLAIYKFPEFFPPQFLNRQLFSTRVLVPRSLKKAKKVIAVSKNTKTDIIEQFNLSEDKIEVIHEGTAFYDQKYLNQLDISAIKKRYGIMDNYILFLGTVEPRKNIVTLIKAFRNLRLVYDSPAKDCQLVIAGARGWKDQPVYKEIAQVNAAILGLDKRRSGRERRSGLDFRNSAAKKKQGERRNGRERRKNQPIKHIGYISHNEKIALLMNAVCFVFPSLYEGFGLPVLEAMSLGVPVITSKTSSLPEIVAEKSGLLVNPEKESELIEALQQILTDEGLRETLAVNGRSRAENFSWKKCALKTLEVYRQAAKGK